MSSSAAKHNQKVASEKQNEVWANLRPIQEQTAKSIKELPGPFITWMNRKMSKADPSFPLTPLVQGALIQAATLSKKRLLSFLRGGSQHKPLSRYMHHYSVCIATMGSAKSFFESCIGPDNSKEVVRGFKQHGIEEIRMLVTHLNQLLDGSDVNITSDAATPFMYKLAASNETLNTYTLITDEADTIVTRIEDGSSSSESRFYLTSWDAGRALAKNDSSVRCIQPHWAFSMFLIMQPFHKIREILYEMETKCCGFAFRPICLTYYKPEQSWTSPANFNAEHSYRAYAKRAKPTDNPLRDHFRHLFAALIIVSALVPDSAKRKNPPGVQASTTPSSAMFSAADEEEAGSLSPQQPTFPTSLLDNDVPEEHDENGEEEEAIELDATAVDDQHDQADAAGASDASSGVVQIGGPSSAFQTAMPPPPRPPVQRAASKYMQLPSTADVFGADVQDETPVLTDEQQKYDRQKKQWIEEMRRIFPANDRANILLGKVLEEYDKGATPINSSKRAAFQAGITGKCKENEMSIADCWEALDSACELLMTCEDKYGSNFWNAVLGDVIVTLYHERKSQIHLDDNFLWDNLTNNHSSTMPEGPIICAKWVCDQSITTNMKIFDTIYPPTASDLTPAPPPGQASTSGQGTSAGKAAAPNQTDPIVDVVETFATNVLKNAALLLRTPGFFVTPNDVDMSSPNFKVAAKHLHFFGLGFYLSIVGTTLKKTKVVPIQTTDDLIQISGGEASAMVAFVKLPTGMIDAAMLSRRLVAASLQPLAPYKPASDPILSSTRKQTREKTATYLVWALTAAAVQPSCAQLLVRPPADDDGNVGTPNALLAMVMRFYLFSIKSKMHDQTSDEYGQAKGFDQDRADVDMFHGFMYNRLLGNAAIVEYQGLRSDLAPESITLAKIDNNILMNLVAPSQ